MYDKNEFGLSLLAGDFLAFMFAIFLRDSIFETTEMRMLRRIKDDIHRKGAMRYEIRRELGLEHITLKAVLGCACMDTR